MYKFTYTYIHIPVVAKANTVTEPGTVMIHTHHTSVAYGAMMSSVRLGKIAFLAEVVFHMGFVDKVTWGAWLRGDGEIVEIHYAERNEGTYGERGR